MEAALLPAHAASRGLAAASYGTSGKVDAREDQSLDAADSVCVLLNAIIGPGLMVLPKLYQQSGFVLPTLLLTAGGGLAALATCARAEANAALPGNENFQRRVEFGDAVLHSFGPAAHAVAITGFCLAAGAQAIAAIAMVASTTDFVFAYAFGRTYGLFLFGRSGGEMVRPWSLNHCSQDDACLPLFTGEDFHGEAVLSLGYAATAVLLVPVCVANLRESMPLQYLSLATCAAASLVFVAASAVRGARTGASLPLVTAAQENTSGVVLFNLMYGIFVSTWLNEKRPDVDAPGVVLRSAAASTVAFVAVGAAVGAAYTDIGANALATFAEPGSPWVVKAAALLFGWFVVASGAPVACVMATHTLRPLVGPGAALAAGVGAPFALAWLFAAPRAYGALLNLSGVFLAAPLALLLPFFLRLAADRPWRDGEGFGTWCASHFQVADPPPRDATPHDPLPGGAWWRARRRPIYAGAALLIGLWFLQMVALLVLDSARA